MTEQAALGASAPPALTLGRRLYRGFLFATFVGVAGAGLAAVPALFVQSIFVGEAQRCNEAIAQAEAGADIPLNCIDEFSDPPVWLPAAIVFGGVVIGVAGGFGYGVASPNPRSRSRVGPDAPWLPF